jgi:hypothetical protein
VRTPADDGVVSHGVFGKSPAGRPFGGSTDQVGVFGSSENFVAVWEETKFVDQPGVFGKNPRLAGRFDGDVEVKGDLRLVGVSDDEFGFRCTAESFIRDANDANARGWESAFCAR